MAESGLSSEVNATTVLPAASGVSATVNSNNNVDLSWTNNDDSSDGGIDVERFPPAGVVASSEIHGKSISIQQDEYGTWVCVENYEHYGGTNPSVGPVDTFPQLGDGLTTADDIEASGTNGELRHVDDIDQYGGWEVDAVRLEATTTNHSRKIHFFTTDQTVIDATFTEQSDETDYTDFQGSSTTLYDDHTANLPVAAGNGDADTRSDRLFGSGFPFYNGGTYHWAVKGVGNRWEVDDYPNDNGSGYQHSTVHRVWIRVTGATEATVLDKAATTVASALAPSTTSYTDTSVSSGETYEYRVERNTDHATATSGTASVSTNVVLTRSITVSGDASITAQREPVQKARAITTNGDGRVTVTAKTVAVRASSINGDGSVNVGRAIAKVRTPRVIADPRISTTRITQRSRTDRVDGDGSITNSRRSISSRGGVVTGDGDVASEHTAKTSTRQSSVAGDAQLTVTRGVTASRQTATRGDGVVRTTRTTSRSRSLTTSGDGDIATARVTQKGRVVTVFGDGVVTTTRQKDTTRETAVTGDGTATFTRFLAKPRTTTVSGGAGAVTSRAEFTEVFPKEQTNNLSWDFSFDEPFGFVSEWITETRDINETDAFTVVIDSKVSRSYYLGVEYDVDGDGNAEHRTEPQHVTRDGQTLVFPSVGDPGQYRLYIQQMRPDDYLRELTVGLTRY